MLYVRIITPKPSWHDFNLNYKKGNKTAQPTTLPTVDTSEISSQSSIEPDRRTDQDRRERQMPKGKMYGFFHEFSLAGVISISTLGGINNSLFIFPEYWYDFENMDMTASLGLCAAISAAAIMYLFIFPTMVSTSCISSFGKLKSQVA